MQPGSPSHALNAVRRVGSRCIVCLTCAPGIILLALLAHALSAGACMGGCQVAACMVHGIQHAPAHAPVAHESDEQSPERLIVQQRGHAAQFAVLMGYLERPLHTPARRAERGCSKCTP